MQALSISGSFRVRRRRVITALLVLPALVTLGAPALATSNTDLRYTQAQVFSGALRYLRIDLGYEVTEQDSSAAYLLFRYLPQGSKDTTHGAIEIVKRGDGVRVAVKLPAMPTYHENVMRDGLVRKLREDYGAEAPPPAPKPPPEKKPKEPSEDGDKAPEAVDGEKPKQEE